MRQHTFYIIAAALLLSVSAVAQEAMKHDITPYYRNALTQMMVYHAEDEFGYDVYEIFKNLPALEKFDRHDLSYRVIDNSKVKNVKGKDTGFHRMQYGGSMVLTAAEKQKNADAMLQLLNDAQIGKRMIAKWFDLKGENANDATFSTKLLESRSDYNATVQDAEMARFTAEGVNVLKAISEELISHSFVLVSDMTYITAEDRAESAKVALNIIGGIMDAFTGKNYGERMAQTAGDIADSYTGFKVWTHSYLFQLVWNDSIANIFYDKYYTETPDPAKIKAFLADNSSFRLTYLGEEDAKAEKTQKVGKYSRSGLLELITRRSIDSNVAKLQSAYEDFRIKTPIAAVEYDTKGKLVGYRALVGLKEGVSENRAYEVLEMKMNNKGKIVYNRVATLKPINNKIWDNRFNALLENDVDVVTEGTIFKLQGTATKQIVPGMLIREI